MANNANIENCFNGITNASPASSDRQIATKSPTASRKGGAGNGNVSMTTITIGVMNDAGQLSALANASEVASPKVSL